MSGSIVIFSLYISPVVDNPLKIIEALSNSSQYLSSLKNLTSRPVILIKSVFSPYQHGFMKGNLTVTNLEICLSHL